MVTVKENEYDDPRLDDAIQDDDELKRERIRHAQHMRNVRAGLEVRNKPSPRQLLFAEGLSKGLSKPKAAEVAGYANPPTNWQMESRSMQLALAKYGIALNQLDKRLGEIVHKEVLEDSPHRSVEVQEDNVALKAIDIGYKRNGAYVHRIESKNLNVNVGIYDEIAARLNRELYGQGESDGSDESEGDN